MAGFDEAQAQNELDELTNHVESVFSEYLSSLDSEPEELDESSIDEVLDRVEKRYGSPGTSATNNIGLTGSGGLARLNVDGKTFTVADTITATTLSGKAKVWGVLQGKQVYAAKSLPFNYFTVVTSDTKSRCVFVSGTRHKGFKGGAGIGTWS